jgi:hypothetical protein
MSESVAGTVHSNASTIQTTASGRGGGSTQGANTGTNGLNTNGNTGTSIRNNRNRNRNRNNGTSNNNNHQNNTVRNNPNMSKGIFKGNTADMNGHVFECYDERGDRTQFSKTLEALGEYAFKNLKYPENLKSIFIDPMTAPKIDMPEELPATATKRTEVIWEASVKAYARRSDELESNLTTLYAVIWGQCSDAMRNKIRALDDYDTESLKNNCIWLLKEINGVAHQFDTSRNTYLSLIDARAEFYNLRQGASQSNASYLAVFTSNVQVLDYYKASFSESYLLVDDKFGTLSVEDRTKSTRDKTLAIVFLRGSDPRRYGVLMSDLANQKIRGNNQYPDDVTSAYSMLVN